VEHLSPDLAGQVPVFDLPDIHVNFRSAVPKKELMKRSVTFELPIKSPFFTVA
jgi:hypothetical protein